MIFLPSILSFYAVIDVWKRPNEFEIMFAVSILTPLDADIRQK